MLVNKIVADAKLKKVAREAAKFYKHSHHDFLHVARVYTLAMRIASELQSKPDYEVLGAAVILHDVARALEDEGKVEDHAAEGAKLAAEVLRKLGFLEEKIKRVAYCIKVHRFRSGIQPETIEAQILQDADRLDMLGAVGVARAFARGGWDNIPLYDPSVLPKERYKGRSETVINHLYEKVLKIKDTLTTEPARRIAAERHRFVVEFVERFLKEWAGEL